MENENIRLLVNDIIVLAAQVSRLVENAEPTANRQQWAEMALIEAHDSLEDAQNYLDQKPRNGK